MAVTCNILSLDRSRAVFTYEGSMMTEGAAHPQALFYTTTVDLDLGTLVGFSDYADAQTWPDTSSPTNAGFIIPPLPMRSLPS